MFDELYDIEFTRDEFLKIKETQKYKEEYLKTNFKSDYDAKCKSLGKVLSLISEVETIILDKFISLKIESELAKDIIKNLDVVQFCVSHIVESEDVLKKLEIDKILPLSQIPKYFDCYNFSDEERYMVWISGQAETKTRDPHPPIKERADKEWKIMIESKSGGFREYPAFSLYVFPENDGIWVIVKEMINDKGCKTVKNTLYIKDGMEEKEVLPYLLKCHFRPRKIIDRVYNDKTKRFDLFFEEDYI